MATTTFDPLKSLTNPAQTGQSIMNSAMAGVPPAPDPNAPQSTGIVGAQSQQLGAPQAWQVTDDQTVEGRINKIIGAGSPLFDRARARATEDATRRGLSNTSMAVTAGEAALYDAAMPIAQADASTFARAAGYNSDQSNQWAVRNVENENQFKLQDKSLGGQMQLQSQQAQSQKDLALIQRDTQVQLSQLDATNKAAADAVVQQNQRVLETNQQANAAFQTAMGAVNNIQNNNQMDGGTKTQAVAQVWRDLQTQLRVLGTVAGLNLTSQLNFAGYPGFDANGNYVGFPGGAPGGGTTAGAPASDPNGPSMI